MHNLLKSAMLDKKINYSTRLIMGYKNNLRSAKYCNNEHINFFRRSLNTQQAQRKKETKGSGKTSEKSFPVSKLALKV